MIVNENSFCSVSVRITHLGNCKLVRPLIKVFSEDGEAFHRILWKLLEHDSKCLLSFPYLYSANTEINMLFNFLICSHILFTQASLVTQDGKESMCNAGDLGSVPGLGGSPGGGHGNPLQYSCLENPMDRRAWWATVHGVAWTVRHNWAAKHTQQFLPISTKCSCIHVVSIKCFSLIILQIL